MGRITSSFDLSIFHLFMWALVIYSKATKRYECHWLALVTIWNRMAEKTLHPTRCPPERHREKNPFFQINENIQGCYFGVHLKAPYDSRVLRSVSILFYFLISACACIFSKNGPWIHLVLFTCFSWTWCGAERTWRFIDTSNWRKRGRGVVWTSNRAAITDKIWGPEEVIVTWLLLPFFVFT